MPNSIFQTLSLRKLSDGQLRTFSQLLVAEVKGATGVEPYLLKITSSLENALDLHEQALAHSSSDPYTAQTSSAGQLRERAFLSFRDGVAAKEHNINPDTEKTASALLSIIRIHGYSLNHLTQSEKTAVISLLVADLDKPEHSALVDKMGLRTELEDMRTCEAAYETVFAARVDNKAQNSTVPLLSPQRNIIIDDITEIANVVSRESRTSADKTVGGLVAKIDGIINSIVPTAKLRSTLAENAAKAESKPATSPAPAVSAS